MDSTHTAAIHQALTRLVDVPLRQISRTANMLMLGFGAERTARSPLGLTRIVHEWALHLQCHWRLCRLGCITIGYRDFYYSPEGKELDDDWDTVGKSQFDTLAKTLCAEFASESPLVTGVAVDDVGGFSLQFKNDYRFDAFPDNSSATSEHWRMFQPGVDSRHFVVSGNALNNC